MEILKVGNLLKENTDSIIKTKCKHCDTVVKMNDNDYIIKDCDNSISWVCPICDKENIQTNPLAIKKEKRRKIADWLDEAFPILLIVSVITLITIVLIFSIYKKYSNEIQSYNYEITYKTSTNLYRHVKAVEYVYYEDDNTLIIEGATSQHYSYHDVEIKTIMDLKTNKEITNYNIVS